MKDSGLGVRDLGFRVAGKGCRFCRVLGSGQLTTHPDASPGGVLQPQVCLAPPPVGVQAVPRHVLHTSTVRVSSRV